MNLFIYIFSSFITGLLTGFTPVIPFIAICALFYKRRILSIALALAMLSGALLSYHPPDLKEGLYDGGMRIEKAMKYDYEASMYNMKFLLKGNYRFLEGDRVYGSFRISRNDKDTGFYEYLRQQGMNNIAVIERIDSVRSEAGIQRLRTILNNRIKRLYKEDTAGFLNSILLGMRSDMPERLKKGFLHSGAMHFLAISGLHTGIIYAFIMALLFFVPLSRYVKLIIVIPFMIFYALLTYMNPPVVRAVMFIIIFTAGIFLRKDTETDNIIMLCAMLMLILNPLNIQSISFQLSFLAVYAVMKGYRTKNRLISILLPSATVMIVTGPVIMNKFNYISFLSPVSTVILLPLIAGMMVLGIISLLPLLGFVSIAVELIYSLTGTLTDLSQSISLFFEAETSLPETMLLCAAGLFLVNRKYRAGVVMFALALITVLFSLL